MLIPETYRDALLEPCYDPEFDDQGYPVKMVYTVHVTHPAVEGFASFTSPELDHAFDLAREAVDTLIESWN